MIELKKEYREKIETSNLYLQMALNEISTLKKALD